MILVESHVTTPLRLPRRSQGPSLLENLRGVEGELTHVAKRTWKTHDSSAACWDWKASRQMLSKKSQAWGCCISNISDWQDLLITKASPELLAAITRSLNPKFGSSLAGAAGKQADSVCTERCQAVSAPGLGWEPCAHLPAASVHSASCKPR